MNPTSHTDCPFPPERSLSHVIASKGAAASYEMRSCLEALSVRWAGSVLYRIDCAVAMAYPVIKHVTIHCWQWRSICHADMIARLDACCPGRPQGTEEHTQP